MNPFERLQIVCGCATAIAVVYWCVIRSMQKGIGTHKLELIDWFGAGMLTLAICGGITMSGLGLFAIVIWIITGN